MALSVGVLIPVMLSTAVGIVTLALGDGIDWVVVGVLVVSFAAAAIGSVITATVLLGKKARTARLQADLSCARLSPPFECTPRPSRAGA